MRAASARASARSSRHGDALARAALARAPIVGAGAGAGVGVGAGAGVGREALVEREKVAGVPLTQALARQGEGVDKGLLVGMRERLNDVHSADRLPPTRGGVGLEL